MNTFIFSAKLAGWLMFNGLVPKNIKRDNKDERFWVFVFEETDILKSLIEVYKKKGLKEKNKL